MLIETIQKTLRKQGNVTLTAEFSEETSFTGGNFNPRNKKTRVLCEFRLEGPTGTLKLDPEFFNVARLNAHAKGFFEVNGKSFTPLTSLPKAKTTRNVRV